MDKISSFTGEYEFLSNFYDAPVTYKGVTFLNSEAAYQAQKDLSRIDEFVALAPGEAKRLGKNVNLREDWEQVKVSIMRDVIRCKFTQHPDLKAKLLATSGKYIEEGNNWGDRTWGTVNGAGKNLLGKVLMEVRDELNRQSITGERS